jgi:hypothetical protein
VVVIFGDAVGCPLNVQFSTQPLNLGPQPFDLGALCFPFCVGDSAVLAKESVLNSQPFDLVGGVATHDVVHAHAVKMISQPLHDVTAHDDRQTR